jgi:hypothetical protein
MIRTALHLEHMAATVTTAVLHISEELARADSWPAGSGGERVSGAQRSILVRHTDNGEEEIDRVPVTGVEAAMFQRYQLTAYREDIRDAITDLGDRAVALDHLLQRVMGTRMPEPPVVQVLCRDGLHGKDMSAELTGDIAVCCERPFKGGLCSRHYMRWYRERKLSGIDVSEMFEPGIHGAA